MASVDKAAIAWSVAIVAVGAGFAMASQSFDTGFAPAPAVPTSSLSDDKIEAAKQQIEMEQKQRFEEERAKAIEEQLMEEQETRVELEEKISISEPTVEVPPQMTGPMTVEVSMPTGTSVPGCEETNECYIPSSVSINVGDTVVWNNDDTAAHTVTSGSPSEGPDGTFDSSLVMAGNSFEVTFDDAGSYDYFCMVHPWMTGNVQVS